MEQAELIPRADLANAVLVAASGWPDQPRAMAAAKRAIRAYSIQPQRGSDWFGDTQDGLDENQARRMVKEFESGVIDGCTTYTSPEHPGGPGVPCPACRSGAEQRAALRSAVLAALESGERPPAADGTGTVPVPRRSQPRRKAPERPPARPCGHCGKPIGAGKPSTARYCTDSCRVAEFNKRKRAK